MCKRILWVETVDSIGKWNHPWLNLFIFLTSRRTDLIWYSLSFRVSIAHCGVGINRTERYRWLSTRWLSDSVRVSIARCGVRVNRTERYRWLSTRRLSDSVRVRSAPQSLSCSSVLMHRSDSLASTLSHAMRKWIRRNYKNTVECWIRSCPLLHCSLYTRRIQHKSPHDAKGVALWGSEIEHFSGNKSVTWLHTSSAYIKIAVKFTHQQMHFY